MNASVKLTPIDRIFDRMLATYGAAWDRSLGSAPIIDTKTVWMHELSGFLQHRRAMQSIAWALENLPERCPNVIEFKNLCRRAPALDVPLLPEPKADPARVAAELDKLAPLRKLAADYRIIDHKDWARRIVDRHSRGDKIKATPLRMARTALGMDAA